MKSQKQYKDPEQGNRLATEIFLSDPKRYAGIQLEWALAWRDHHPSTGTPAENITTILRRKQMKLFG